MNQTAAELKSAIDLHRRRESEYELSREHLRMCVRRHLQTVTAERGSLAVLAAALQTGSTALANVKSGCATPSANWAEKLLKATTKGK